VVRRVTLPSIPRTPLIDTANPAAHMPLDPLQERIARTALAITGADHDSVYFVPACVTCWSTVHVLGQATLDPPTLFWAAP
jgi:hypothetical protein